METSDRGRGARGRRGAADEADRRARRGRRRADGLGQLRRARGRAGAPFLKILGLDPGLRTTGWGLIEAVGNRLSHIANGQIKTDTSTSLPRRLAALADQLEALIADFSPAAAAVEEVFVNKNPQSTLKLGQARGVALMCAARAGIDVGEYAPTLVKKAVVGTGGADKAQVHAMVSRLLPGVKIAGPDAADALAVAILSALTPDELVRAVAQDDKAMIGRANGVGPKLAARIANELQGKLGVAGLAGATPARRGGAASDALSALANLGFKPAEASAAVNAAQDELGPEASLDALVRLALRKAAK